MERAAAVFSERLLRVEWSAVHAAGAAATDLGDGSRPFAGGGFPSCLRRSHTDRLRPLAAAKPAAPGPSLAQGRLPTEASQPSTNKGSEATGSEGR